MTIGNRAAPYILIGASPVWPYSQSWGYGPSGGLGLLVIILIVLLVMGLV